MKLCAALLRLVAVSLVTTLLGTARAQPAAAVASVPPAAVASPTEPGEVQPTTTVATGDRGGLFFGQPPDPQKSRHYYLAAEHERWDFASTGRDDVCGLPLPAALLANRATGKTRYVHYTDASFGARAFAEPALGILGPVLRGVVGEFLVVTFLNRTDQPLSLHPHGVRYDKDSEGAYYQPAPGRGAAVAPGATFTYVWLLDAASGPLPTEPSSRGWLYHSHVAGEEETNLGLVGTIIVTDPARARADGTPAEVDREFATLFMIFDESGLDATAREAAEYAALPGAASPPMTWEEVQQTLADSARPSLNGRMFGHLTALAANTGERVRWYLFGLGSQRDFHAPTWSGLRVTESGRRTGTLELLPASMKVADLVADTAGTWLFRCHVAEHMRNGMFTRFAVHAPDTVGADRSPAHAFLGQPAALQSVRLTRAEVRTENGAPTLHLTGAVTAYDGYAIFNQPFTVRLGDATATFRPNAAGQATAAEGTGSTLRITNATEFGVINGGVMEFAVRLAGAEWVAAGGSPAASAELRLSIGRAHHTTALRAAP